MTRVNDVWLELLGNLLTFGTQRAPRGQKTLELLGFQTVIPMTDPVVTVARRGLGRKFMAAEAAWILSGDNRVSSIAPFSKEIAKFSDDELTFNGAYGPKFIEQVSYVVRTLERDHDSRQAVLTTWRERPGDTVDVPCTIAQQYLIRDDRLHCVATMRSSDCWLGAPYDWHAFSMMAAYVLLSLRYRASGPSLWHKVSLGNLFFTAGSQHLYLRDKQSAEFCLDDPYLTETLYPAYQLDSFTHPDHLVAELWKRAGR